MTEHQLLAARESKRREYDKKKSVLRYRLLGMTHGDKDWFKALRALDFGEAHHTGFRKDNVTPSFMHQIDIALYTLTLLPHLIFPVRTIIAVILHDTPEDTTVSHEEIRDNFGPETEVDVELLTKEYRGEKKSPEHYFGELAKSAVSSIGKGCDRINNQFTMNGVFNLTKQMQYCDETRKYFFKFLKLARRAFPEQDLAYENIKFVLNAQLRVFNSVNSQGIAA